MSTEVEVSLFRSTYRKHTIGEVETDSLGRLAGAYEDGVELEFGCEEIEACLAQDGAVYSSKRLATRRRHMTRQLTGASGSPLSDRGSHGKGGGKGYGRGLR